MSLISSVMLVQSDPRLGDGLRYSFEREGTAVRRAEPGPTLKERLASDCQLIVTGTPDRDAGLSLLVELRRALAARSLRIPVLYVGNGLSREEALDVGATEFLPPPVYVRDLITMARILCSPIKELNSAVTGELSDHFGLFYIVRALSAVKRKGVLTLVRGLRRGELRFFEGEVTSAQVGMLHGLAALHQLLLWTDARFELRPENVVRRQQIPLSPAELLENSQEFLRDIREVAEGMSPSSVYQPDAERAAKAMTNAPDEVRTVYRLFDGNRSVADVIEDSPYRVFETLRIANRLKTYGAIAKVAKEKKGGARTALAIEEWLVDGGSTATLPPVGAPTQSYGRRKKKKRRRGASPSPPPSPSAPVDWGSLPDRRTGVSDGDPFSPVVPSASASGEINAVRLPAEPARGIEPPGRAAVEVAPVVESPPPRPREPEPAPAVAAITDLAEIPDLSGQWETDAEMDAETPLPPLDEIERPAPVRSEPMVASGEIKAAAVPRILVEPAGPAIVIDESVAQLTAPHVAPPPPTQAAPAPVVSADADTSAVPVPIPKTPTQPHAAPPPPGATAEPAAAAVEPAGKSAAPEPAKAAPEPVKAAPETVKAIAPPPAKVAAPEPVKAAPETAKAVAPSAKPAAPEPVKAAPETVKAVAPPPAKVAAPEPAKPAPEPAKPAPEPAKLVSPEQPPSPAVPPPSPFAREREAAALAPEETPAPAPKEAPRAAKEPPPTAAKPAGRKKRKSTQPPIDEKDAFTDAEHAFFSAGTEVEPSADDSFDDLDEDYEVPRSFWQRLLSRPDQAPRRKR